MILYGKISKTHVKAALMHMHIYIYSAASYMILIEGSLKIVTIVLLSSGSACLEYVL